LVGHPWDDFGTIPNTDLSQVSETADFIQNRNFLSPVKSLQSDSKLIKVRNISGFKDTGILG
jgi:hypothetical protein